MSVEFRAEDYTAETIQIAAEVLRTMAGIEAEPEEGKWTPDGEHLTSAVFFSGDWMGALFVECEATLSRTLAARLCGAEGAELTSADVCDAMSEVANMIGGNLKGLMPVGVSLSIPSTVRGSDYAVRLRNAGPISRSLLSTPFGKVWITVASVQAGAKPQPVTPMDACAGAAE